MLTGHTPTYGRTGKLCGLIAPKTQARPYEITGLGELEDEAQMSSVQSNPLI